MLVYYSKFVTWRVFSYHQVVNLCGNRKTADSLLYTYVKRGLVSRVTKALYVAISLETGTSVASPFEIGSNITPSSYISHHSAFSFYGFSNQVFHTITVSSSSRFKPFSFEGYRYEYKQSNISEGIIESHGVKISDLERTIIDNIQDFSKTAGLEELLRSLNMITVVDGTKLLQYLAIYNNRFLYQKTGYILSHFKPLLKLPESFFDTCKIHIGKSIRYLSEDTRLNSPVYDSKWQLYVPENLIKIIDYGGDEIV